MWILVQFQWPKVVILGLVFIVYVPYTHTLHGSTGLCGFKNRSHDPKWSYKLLFSSSMFHARMLKNTSTLVRQRPGNVDFSTVPMTQSGHTSSCFHRLCSMQVFCKKRKLWVDRVMWILEPFSWPKVVILGPVFIDSVPCKYSVKYVNFGSTWAG